MFNINRRVIDVFNSPRQTFVTFCDLVGFRLSPNNLLTSVSVETETSLIIQKRSSFT